MNLVLLAKAIELLGVTNPEKFKRDAKRFGCLHERSGIIKIELDKFQSELDAEFERDAQAALLPKTKKRGDGHDLGLIMGRLKLYPDRKAKKLVKINSAKDAIKAAATPHERKILKGKLSDLEGQLQRLEDGKLADEARRDEILNADDDSDVKAQ